MANTPIQHPAASEQPETGRSVSLRLLSSIAAALVLLVFAGLQTHSLRRYRHEHLVRNAAYSADAPPLLMFANVALGGFRGIIADLLWLRASRMQQEGRYIELVQLSEWITALEPDNGEVWAYHAWNMSYNVSIMMTRVEDRWRWVQNGLYLLIEKGVRFNPSSAQVRRELAWIFQHKLGMDGDSAGPYYRREWARTVATYLEPDGSPPDPDSLNGAELPTALGLSPRTMQAIDQRFGKLDWRVPCAHAVYWALEGLELATERERLPCRRIVYQSLIMMIRGDGRLIGDPEDEAFVFRAEPNTALLEGTIDFLEETNEEHRFHGVRMAFCGLLFEGVHIDMKAGREAEARAKYHRAAELFGGADRLPTFEALSSGRAEVDWNRFRQEGD